MSQKHIAVVNKEPSFVDGNSPLEILQKIDEAGCVLDGLAVFPDPEDAVESLQRQRKNVDGDGKHLSLVQLDVAMLVFDDLDAKIDWGDADLDREAVKDMTIT